jgi:chemotaxis methyl-accepting protein methylase
MHHLAIGAKFPFLKTGTMCNSVRSFFNFMLISKIWRFYTSLTRRIFSRLPAVIRSSSLGRAYGGHLHRLVRLHVERGQNHSTFFLRNQAELELMRRLVDKKAQGSRLNLCVLGCSNGAEVYSILWSVRSARPDLNIRTHGIDVSQDILDFAARAVYSLTSPEVVKTPNGDLMLDLFERISPEEMESVFDLQPDRATVKPWLKEGITWLCQDAMDSGLRNLLEPQDIVVANRFMCHMTIPEAEKCLRNVARIVKPGGYLFVAGMDVDVRAAVAKALGWKPVTDLMKQVHEGDVSLTNGWPWEYWGLEPFSSRRPDWQIRYASVFQIGEIPPVDSIPGSASRIVSNQIPSCELSL